MLPEKKNEMTSQIVTSEQKVYYINFPNGLLAVMNELQLVINRNIIFDPMLQIGGVIFDSLSGFGDKFF